MEPSKMLKTPHRGIIQTDPITARHDKTWLYIAVGRGVYLYSAGDCMFMDTKILVCSDTCFRKNDKIWEDSTWKTYWDPQRLKIVHTSIKKSFYLGTVQWCHEAYTVPVGNDPHIHSFSEPLNKLISLQEGSDLSTCQACEHTTGIHPQRGCCHLILKESYGIAMPKSCFHAMAYIYMWWWLQCE